MYSTAVRSNLLHGIAHILAELVKDHVMVVLLGNREDRIIILIVPDYLAVTVNGYDAVKIRTIIVQQEKVVGRSPLSELDLGILQPRGQWSGGESPLVLRNRGIGRSRQEHLKVILS